MKLTVCGNGKSCTSTTLKKQSLVFSPTSIKSKCHSKVIIQVDVSLSKVARPPGFVPEGLYHPIDLQAT